MNLLSFASLSFLCTSVQGYNIFDRFFDWVDDNKEAADSSDPVITDPYEDEDMTGKYIVYYDTDALRSSRFSPTMATKRLSEQSHSKVRFGGYNRLIDGFVVENLSHQGLKQLQANPLIKEVVQDQVVRIAGVQTGEDLAFGLDRLEGPIDQRFEYPDEAGLGVDAYIIDTGINTNHKEFAGRVAPDNEHFSAYDDEFGFMDCHGHGTHVASTMAGTEYGVAKRSTVHAVRVMGCSGSGGIGAIVAGMNWVREQCENGSKRCVVNMSIGASGSSLNNAANNLVAAGIVTLAAAGNERGQDACTKTPAGASDIITVGSTTKDDVRSGFSNIGNCTDIFAVGSSILGAWYTSDTATRFLSGTSMATPLVAGVACLIVQDMGASFTPALVLERLQDEAFKDVIEDIGEGSPNLLVQMTTVNPSDMPSSQPTMTPAPTITDSPTNMPSISVAPSLVPSVSPSLAPSEMPSMVTCNDPEEVRFELFLHTDKYSDETSFVLIDDCSGEEVFASPEGEDLPSEAELTYAACLPLQGRRFEFTIFDSLDDGLSAPGFYRLTLGDTILKETNQFLGYDFGSEDTTSVGSECWTPEPSVSLAPSVSMAPSEVPSQLPSLNPTVTITPSTFPSYEPTGLDCDGDESALGIFINADGFASETSFTVTNECTEEVILEEDYFENHRNYSFITCVSSEDKYEFKILDSAKDGIFYPAGYRVVFEGTEIHSGDLFGSEDIVTFGEEECNSDPTKSPFPSVFPSVAPSMKPSGDTPAPSLSPSVLPSDRPTTTGCENAGEVEVKVGIRTDAYGNEISFVLSNKCNSLEVLSADENTLENEKLHTYTKCVPAQAGYNFIIRDSFGDGIFFPGYYSVKFDGAEVEQPEEDFKKSQRLEFGIECQSSDESPAPSAPPSAAPSAPPFAAPSATPSKEPAAVECSGSTKLMKLDLQADSAGSQISYTISNACSNQQVLVMPPGTLSDGERHVVNECLNPNEAYKFVLEDSGGNGIASPGYFNFYFDEQPIALNPPFFSNFAGTFGYGTCVEPPRTCPCRKRRLRRVCQRIFFRRCP